MHYGQKSRNNWIKKTYEAQLGYLEYDDEGDRLSVPYQIRERHLTQDTQSCSVQAIGIALQVSVWSERDNITLMLPHTHWETSKEMSRKFTGENNGLICIGRFEDAIATRQDDDGEPIVDAFVTVHGLDHG